MEGRARGARSRKVPAISEIGEPRPPSWSPRAVARAVEAPGIAAAVLESLQEGVLVHDTEGHVIEANAAVCALLGLSREELFHPEGAAHRLGIAGARGRPLLPEEWPSSRARRTGTPQGDVLCVRRPDGSTAWLRVRSTPVRAGGVGAGSGTDGAPEPERRPVAVCTTLVDITAQVAHAEELAVGEHRFDRVFTDSPAGIAVLDLDGRFLQANLRLTALLGRDGLRSLDLTAVIHPEDRAAEAVDRARLLAGTAPFGTRRTRFLARDGATVWASLTLSVVRDRLGEPLHLIAQVEDLTELQRAQDLLERRTLYDNLTGLANRTLLLDRLAHALSRHAREHELVGVVFCDLDRFKRVNDSLGHEAGDRLLQEVARRVQQAVRPGDTVARLGGDEFVVVLEHTTSLEEVTEGAERVRAAVEQVVTIGPHEVLPALSAGVTACDGSRPAEAVLRDADTALHAAKESGGARTAVFDEGLRARALRRLSVEAELRRAIAEEQFVVHYQPIVALGTGEVASYEALVRWMHPERGLLLPDEFVPVCEDAGLVVALGRLVLRDSCAFLARHPDFAGRVFVNVSPRQLGAADCAGMVSATLAEHGVPGSRLGLEITENGVLNATGLALADMTRIVEQGVTLVMDDFGTGYSALSSVLAAPVGGLKLDRTFTLRLGDGGVGDRISAALAGVVETIGGYGVVEGIETPEQRWRALEHGWTHGQGWLFGRPVPESQLGLEPTRRLPTLRVVGGVDHLGQLSSPG